MKPLKLLVAAALCLALLVAAPAAHAWRQPVLNLGLTNVLDGAAPPPGLYLSMYTLVSTAPSANVKDAALLAAFPNLSKLDSTTTAIAPQIIWVTPYKCPVTGANLGFDFFPVLGSISADLAESGLPAGAVNNSPVGDVYFGPFLAFHHVFGEWQLHWVAEFDSIAPAGQYDNTKILQLASNHWTIEPFVAFTLFTPGGFELSSRMMYTYNFENDDFGGAHSKMTPGQAFHMNYTLTACLGSQKLRGGIVGYYLQQLDEDEIDGVKINDSEERAFAVGPVIWYNKGDFIFEAKTLFDVDVQNRPKAVTGVLRIVYNF